MDYEMNNTQILSPKVFIDEALVFLGMASMDKAMRIKTLLRISELDGLSLFFDEPLFCVPTSVKYGDQYDSEGEYIETLKIDSADVKEFWSEHMLASFQLCKEPDSSLNIMVNRVVHDGAAYHIYQCNLTVSEGVLIGYEKFYFDRDELIKHKDEYSAHFSQSQQEKSLPSKKPLGITDQRITAFKYWLVGSSGKSVHKDEDLQACYIDLNEPTKKKVWERLHLMDNKLFASGEDDFIKAVGSIIKFTQGTGKNRGR
jgi:hypothetical protein